MLKACCTWRRVTEGDRGEKQRAAPRRGCRPATIAAEPVKTMRNNYILYRKENTTALAQPELTSVPDARACGRGNEVASAGRTGWECLPIEDGGAAHRHDQKSFHIQGTLCSISLGRVAD